MNTYRSTKLLWLSLALSIVHHADHILRIDHSGWITRFGYRFGKKVSIDFIKLSFSAKLFDKNPTRISNPRKFVT